MADDADHPARPKKLLLIAAGLLFGLLVGAACALMPMGRAARTSR
jgi:uncharacterized protein involved in exopolysaccharide biosynthesis